MSTEVKCPSCNHSFPLEEAIGKEYEQELRDKMIAWQKKKDEEFQRKEEELKGQQKDLALKYEQQLIAEKTKLEEGVRKTIAADFENKFVLLETSFKESEEKLKLSRQKELTFMQREQELKNKESEIELNFQRKLQEERLTIAEQIRKQEIEKNQIRETEHQLRVKEFEKQLEDQKKLVDEMRRKAEQGSMQLQGEVQELALEELLRAIFPFDKIGEVGKGVKGADVVHLVHNPTGKECGTILYESKRTKNFSNDWIDKLKNDLRAHKADIAVIVTEAMPKDMDRFGMKDGIWICSFLEFKGVAAVLRDSLIRIADIKSSQENKGDKMQMLYDFLTGNEFKQHIEAIVEGFTDMKKSLLREKTVMERMWAERDKQLDKVLLNTSGMYGSIKGIAGNAVAEVKLLDIDNLYLDENKII